MRMTWLRLVVIAAVTAFCYPTYADQIFLDFESYPQGKITNGYDGWQITNPNWDQSVTNSSPINGANSWRISNLLATGSFGDQPFTPALATMAGESSTGAASNYFAASMLFKPLAGGVLGEGTSISLDRGDGARGNWMRIENTGGDQWKLAVTDYNGNAFVETTLATGLLSGSVYELAFDMTFVDGLQNDIWNVYLNGNLLFTGVGWEDYFQDAQPGIGPPLAYDRLLFRQGGTSSPGAVGILFDDIFYTNVAAAEVPEPASLAIWSLIGVAGLAYRRRRSKQAC